MLPPLLRPLRRAPFLRRLSTSSPPSSIAIVGSGPAAFYTADALLDSLSPPPAVHLFERLPVPFGLVRYGVAPDHPDVKKVGERFNEVMGREGCRWFGGVEVGKDVTVEELRRRYSAVVLACGAQNERRVGVEGENLRGVFSSLQFVSWYNGHPDFRDLPISLANTHRAVVVGNGNVSLDVARILSCDPARTASTDIADYAQEALAAKKVEEVVVVGRRGPVHAPWTAKELREILMKNKGCVPSFEAGQLELFEEDKGELETRTKKRCFELLVKAAAADNDASADARRRLKFLFYRSVSKFTSTDGAKLSAVSLTKNAIVGPPGHRRAAPIPDCENEQLDCELAVQSIGYRGEDVLGMAFDHERGVVTNVEGRVLPLDAESRLSPVYVSGWLKRGPSGIIGTNLWDAKETARNMTEDFFTGKFMQIGDAPGVEEMLREKGVQVVDAEGWARIDAEEKKRGAALGKERLKLTRREDMLRCAGQ